MKLIDKIFMLFTMAIVTAAPLQAKYVQTAKVRYQTSEGPSQWYNVDVNFLTGDELNKANGSFKYNFFKNYGVIFWGDDKASEILIENTFLFCSGIFDSNCLPIFGKMKGPDQQGRQWDICTAMLCS